jgi:alkylated DNA repair dioxygenase AlkB
MKTFTGSRSFEGDLRMGGHLIYTADFLTDEEGDQLADELLEEAVWTKGVYKMYGRNVETPRMLSAMMNKSVDQKGSIWNENTEWVKTAKNWSPLVKKLKKKIEEQLNCKIQYAQMNHYRTGEDYIGYHTDSEVGSTDIVASVSLGGTRRFLLRERKEKSGEADYELLLRHGSLLVFDQGAAKLNYKHCVPKLRKSDNFGHEKEYGRINITFRTQNAPAET